MGNFRSDPRFRIWKTCRASRDADDGSLATPKVVAVVSPLRANATWRSRPTQIHGNVGLHGGLRRLGLENSVSHRAIASDDGSIDREFSVCFREGYEYLSPVRSSR